MLVWIRTDQVLLDSFFFAAVVSYTHSRLMAKYLYRAGNAYERKQRLEAARLVQQQHNAAGSGEIGMRQWRLVESYEGELEQAFLSCTADLMSDPGWWAALPAEMRTQSAETRCFKLLIRGYVLVSELQTANTNYPKKLLATVRHPDLVPVVHSDAACPRRLGAWCQNFIDRHPDVGSQDRRDHYDYDRWITSS